jgi:Gnt-I system high-affinity gluconate transporter
MILLPVLAAVALLVGLIAWARVHPFIAFLLAAIVAALLVGLPVARIPETLERGMGSMLGPLAGIVVLGAMFGKLIADSGAARRIAASLIGSAGTRRIPFAMAATGFVVGVPLFYNVGFVLLVPLVFSVVYTSRLPAVYVGIPAMAGLSITHGFLPPHPSPSALVTQFGADMGLTLVYGLIVGIPTLLIAGPLFAQTLRRLDSAPPTLFAPDPANEAAMPPAFASFACALLPVLLIAAATAFASLPGLDPTVRAALGFVGNPLIVLLVSLGIGTAVLGTGRGIALARLMDGYGAAIRDIAGILLIVAGAGALKQVFVDGGIDAELGALLGGLPVPPLVLGWLLALAIRVALGSATVAGLTAAGLVQPLVASGAADPNLMVLAIGAGSLMCSHVNDSGFWMFKEYFGLSLRDTFRSWTLMETITGTVGLVFVLLLATLVG